MNNIHQLLSHYGTMRCKSALPIHLPERTFYAIHNQHRLETEGTAPHGVSLCYRYGAARSGDSKKKSR
ncbi:MAG: hypothetical protein U0Y96_05295 [Candidatus Kapaibacterium sp.]